MKHVFDFTIILLIVACLFSGCTQRNQYGECVGLLDKKVPGKVYEYSIWNCFLGIFFSQTIVVPALVVTTALECPVK